MAHEIVIRSVNNKAEAREFVGPEYSSDYMKFYGAFELTRFVVNDLGIEGRLAFVCASLLRMALVDKVEPESLMEWIGGMRNFEKKARAYHKKVWAPVSG